MSPLRYRPRPTQAGTFDIIDTHAGYACVRGSEPATLVAWLHNLNRTCLACGAPIKPTASSSYCSAACRQVGRWLERLPPPAGAAPVCRVCGGPLSAPLRGPYPEYCSGRCRQRAYRVRLHDPDAQSDADGAAGTPPADAGTPPAPADADVRRPRTPKRRARGRRHRSS